MNTLELTDKREQLKIEAQNILNCGKNENRKLNDEETNKYNDLCKQITDIDEEIRNIEEQLKNKTKKENNKRNMKENFSLLKAIRSIANNQPLDEVSSAVVNMGIEEMRKSGQNYTGQIILPMETRATMQATVEGQGEEVVAENLMNIVGPLRDSLVMVQAGADFMTGLVGNVTIPFYSGSTVGWEGEIDAAKDGSGTFSEIELSPKRLTAYIDVSKQFLIQDSVGAEALLRSDIVRALSNKLEATILGDAAGSNKQPEGIFNGASAATLTYDGMIDMQTTLEEANVPGEYKFICSPAVKATLRKAKVDEGSGRFVYEAGEIDGIPTLVTNAAEGIVLGNWADYIIAQWGAIDLTVDPYTQAANGKVRLVINAFFDAKPRRAEAFVAGTV